MNNVIMEDENEEDSLHTEFKEKSLSLNQYEQVTS